MAVVPDSDRASFFEAVDEASKKAIWCAIATNGPNGPRVRMVHPSWERDTLWFATGASSPKIAHMQSEPRVDIQYQVAPPDFIHILVRGQATIVTDEAEKKRVWDVIDYDLSQFWSGGPTYPNYAPIRIAPTRVELSKMFGSMEQRVWRAR